MARAVLCGLHDRQMHCPAGCAADSSAAPGGIVGHRQDRAGYRAGNSAPRCNSSQSAAVSRPGARAAWIAIAAGRARSVRQTLTNISATMAPELPCADRIAA